MPDDPSISFAQQQSRLAAIERKSRARGALAKTVTPDMARLANDAALRSPQVARSYPGAVAVAAQSGDQANVDAVVEGGTEAKNDGGDWWNPGDALSAIGSTVASAGEAVGGALSTASSAVSGAAVTATKAVTRGVTAGAQSAWQLAENVYENRAPLSNDVANMTFGNTAADEAARQAETERLQRIGGGTGDNPLGGFVGFAQQAAATDLGQVATQLATTGKVDMGSGFFPGGAVATDQAEAARQVRGVIPGTNSARTIGRDVAVSFTEPGSGAYNVLSGLVDASAVMLLDPVNKLHPFKGLLSGAGKEPLIANVSFIDEAKTSVDEMASWVAAHPKATDDVREAATEAVGRINAGLDAGKAKDVRKAANQLAGLVAKVEPGSADDATKFAAGMVEGIRNTVHLPTAAQWVQANNDLMQRFADDNSYLSIFHRLGGKVDPRIVTELVDASDAGQAASIFLRHLGGDIVQAPGKAYRGALGEASLKFRDWVSDHRTFADMPGQELLTDVRGATPNELIQSVKDAENALINARVPAHIRDDLVERYARSLSGTAQSSYDSGRAVLAAIEAQLAHGSAAVPDNLAREIVNGMSDDIDSIRSYAKDMQGNGTDYGLADALRAGGIDVPGLEDLASSSIISPVQLEQGIRRAIDLPDARVVRRLTAHPVMRALTTQGFKGATEAAEVGLPRMPFSALDWFTTNAFKRLAVLRLAFIPRVVGEEMVYLGVSGGPSPFTHPIHFLSLANGKDFRAFDVLDEAFAKAPKGTMERELTAFQQAINVGVDLSDPNASTKLVHAAGDASIAHKGADADRWIQGMSDHLAASNTNPLKRMVAEGQTTDDIMKYLRSKKGSGDLAELQDMLNRKGVLYEGATSTRLKLDLSSDSVLRTYIDTIVRGDVRRIAGDNPELLEAIAKGILGSEEIPFEHADVAAWIKRGETNDGSDAVIGSRVRLKDGRAGTIVESDSGLAVQLGAPAWEGREASDGLKDALAKWQAHPDSADAIDVWTRPAMRRAMTDGDVISRAMKKVTRVFFGHLYGRASDYLVRAPFFKQTYWDEMGKLLPNLSPDEANKALKMLERHMSDGNRLVDKQLDSIIAKAKTAGGTLDLEAADALAKGRALDIMHDTFYDWSRKSQFWDISRNIFPFGAAWKEMLTRYARLLKDDPVTMLRRAQLAVNGKNDSGWFTRDATTGLETFNMPLVGPLAKILTGGDIRAHGSLQGLTLATDVIPGLGPAAQIAVSQFLPDVPTTQGIEDLLFPYGRPKGSPTSLLPGWTQNAISAVFDKRNTTRLYGNTYKDVMYQLAASGDYNLSDQAEVRRLMDDAASRARPLALFKTALQFVSPTSPTLDYVVDTKHGDVLAAMILDDLDAMRQANPENYTQEFLDKYGEDAFIYLQGKTRAILGGQEPTTAFGDWEQTHRDAVKEHPDVAGYFAPTGGDFDFEVWRRQLNNGGRRYLTDREIIDSANATMARWQYYSVRDKLPAKLSPEQSLTLSELRKALAKKYPGYDPTGDSTPSKVALRVNELRDAAKMPDLANSDVGKALTYYFTARDAVDAQAVKSGVHSFTDAKAFAPQRETLRQLGAVLTQKYPNFQRVWDEVLSREMKDDTPEPTQAAA